MTFTTNTTGDNKPKKTKNLFVKLGFIILKTIQKIINNVQKNKRP